MVARDRKVAVRKNHILSLSSLMFILSFPRYLCALLPCFLLFLLLFVLSIFLSASSYLKRNCSSLHETESDTLLSDTNGFIDTPEEHSVRRERPRERKRWRTDKEREKQLKKERMKQNRNRECEYLSNTSISGSVSNENIFSSPYFDLILSISATTSFLWEEKMLTHRKN